MENIILWLAISSVILNKLRAAVKIINMANKLFCNLCSKPFLSGNNLTKHMVSHTAEKLHKRSSADASPPEHSEL